MNIIYLSGELYQFDDVNHQLGVRPVINLRSDTLISQGDGSIENPFQLKLS